MRSISLGDYITVEHLEGKCVFTLKAQGFVTVHFNNCNVNLVIND